MTEISNNHNVPNISMLDCNHKVPFISIPCCNHKVPNFAYIIISYNHKEILLYIEYILVMEIMKLCYKGKTYTITAQEPSIYYRYDTVGHMVIRFSFCSVIWSSGFLFVRSYGHIFVIWFSIYSVVWIRSTGPAQFMLTL